MTAGLVLHSILLAMLFGIAVLAVAGYASYKRLGGADAKPSDRGPGA